MQAHLVEARVEAIESLLALRAANDLADAGRKNVHRGDGLAVVVLAHVEGLDVLRIIHHGHGATDVGLGQPTLVLALHVDAPLDGVVELHALAHSVLERGDGIGVVHPGEVGGDELLEALDAGLVDALGEELHVVGAFGEQGLEHEFQQVFGELRISE